MSKQVHFVVAVDLETKRWWIDDGTFTARFGSDEGTWDTETQEWSSTTWEENLDALGILNPIGQENN